jgi:Peptidase_C39 like family
LEGLYIKNERGDSYSLPDGVNALSSDQFLLIIFDGTNIVEDKTIHASQTGFLNPESGFIELYASDETLLDRVAWGADQPASVNLSRGGDVADLEPGMTIGRFPLSIENDPLEWTIFSPAQATAGAPNPQPAVEVMIPLNGAVLKQLSFQLNWYPAPGALEYRVQVSADESFDAPMIDDTVNEPALSVELQPGTYFWRVQAVPEDSAVADFSPIQKITLDPGFSSTARLAAPHRQTVLGVPFMSQHKDTAMLLLESKNEKGVHAWDVPHPEMDRTDPADNANCALASIAMINAYLGGDLSQDRLGYELYKDVWPGPEYDLNYGRGLDSDQEQLLLTFALDAEPTYRPAPESLDMFWADIQWEIDEDRPVFGTKPGHAFVITGYYEDTTTRYLMINDPSFGQYAIDLEAVNWAKYFVISPDSIPVFSEPEIGMDSDRDGMVDFDESERFHTDPHNDDFDKDDLKDKDDVRASIFDEHFGYAIIGSSEGRDYDNDGVAMELDEDADGGGCFDGMGDFDLDGKYKEPETWNFDEKDDACFWGTNELVLDDTNVYEDGDSHHQYQRLFAKFSLRAVEDGKLEGVAQVSYTFTGESIQVNDPTCGGTYTLVGGETQFWQADLKGDFRKLPDGSTQVSAEATPDHGPAYTLQWVGGPCAGEPSHDEGLTFSGVGGILKDGVYDVFADLSSGSTYEELWQRIHMEQGQGME